MRKSDDLPERSFHYAKEQFNAVIDQTEDYVREKPAQSLLYAFVAGLIANRLPLGRIAGGLLRLGFFAFKPAILIYGATKLYQAMEEDK